MPDAEWHAWADALGSEPPAAALAGADGVIHLLGGEPVAPALERGRQAADPRVARTLDAQPGGSATRAR